MKNGKRIKRFLTVYTASVTTNEPDWPISHLVLGSYLSRGDAIRKCADYVIEQMALLGQVRLLAGHDDRIVDALKDYGMSDDGIAGLPIDRKMCGWEIPDGPRKVIEEVIVDVLGGDSCFILKSQTGALEFRYDVDENDVEGSEGLQLWTCITSGYDGESHDPEWEQAYPEAFLNEKDAIRCVLEDLMQCLEGYSKEDKKAIFNEAHDRIVEDGHFEFDLNDRKQRIWDVWSTPIDIGQGSGKIQRI